MMKNQSSKIIVACLLLLCVPIYAQVADSTLKENFRFDLSGGFYYQSARADGDKGKEIRLPSYLSQRRPQEPELANLWGLNNDLATDSPMGHGASYIRFHSWYSVNEALEIYGSLEGNHGGFSFGAYNTFAFTILPRYYASYKNIFNLGGNNNRQLKLNGKVGTFENLRLHEGLTVYNLDLQGLQTDIRLNRLQLTITSLTDLKAGVGLNIDGVRDFAASLQELAINDQWKADIGGGAQIMVGTSDSQQKVDFVSLSGALYNDDVRFYAEAGRRFTDEDFSSSLRSAILVGMKGTKKSERLNANYSLEYRRYGQGFNYRFRDETTTHYRDTEKSVGVNFIGDQVYPISAINRPFSQWAVFTEYDKQWVSGLIFYAQMEYKTSKRIVLTAEADFNLINADDEEAFLYPFFKAGIKLEAAKGTYLAATLTNKTMNLDKHYQTYYQLKQPLFQFELRRDVGL